MYEWTAEPIDPQLDAEQRACLQSDPPPDCGTSDLMPHLVIVRSGHAGAYETLKTEFESAANTDVRVVWDRRQEERRGTTETVDRERRHRERRGTAPLTWTSLAVVVVAVETTDP